MMLLGMVDLSKPSYDFNLIIVYETHCHVELLCPDGRTQGKIAHFITDSSQCLMGV